MSRRYVKTSRINELSEVKPQIVSVISAKDHIESRATSQIYFKRNYIEALRQVVPDFYFDDERLVSGTHISYANQLINSHILANKNQETILPVSSLVYNDPAAFTCNGA